jgi:hypothetical protein
VVRLFGIFSLHAFGEAVAFAGPDDFARLKRNGEDAGDEVLQPVFADLVMEPGDLARVSRCEFGSLTELAGALN